jgi:hypothetical protein
MSVTYLNIGIKIDGIAKKPQAKEEIEKIRTTI